LTDFDDGMVYAMALSGGTAIPDAPRPTTSTPIIDLLPLPVSTLEAEAGIEVARALSPAATAINLATPDDVAVPPVEESGALPQAVPIGEDEAAGTADTALSASSDPDDHLTEEESLELSEDLPVG
jgi:hypothetical protein